MKFYSLKVYANGVWVRITANSETCVRFYNVERFLVYNEECNLAVEIPGKLDRVWVCRMGTILYWREGDTENASIDLEIKNLLD